jgi:hypothetical protein
LFLHEFLSFADETVALAPADMGRRVVISEARQVSPPSMSRVVATRNRGVFNSMSASLRLAELLKFVAAVKLILVSGTGYVVVVCGLQLLVGCTNTGASEQ